MCPVCVMYRVARRTALVYHVTELHVIDLHPEVTSLFYALAVASPTVIISCRRAICLELSIYTQSYFYHFIVLLYGFISHQNAAQEINTQNKKINKINNKIIK